MQRIALVTGGTSGIGLVTAKELKRQGFRVVITARNPARAEGGLEVLECDFSSLDSVRAAAAEYRRRYDRLHVLVNNAGGINPKRVLSKDGIELTFQVNHLGYFLLTNLLLDVLQASRPARVVSVSSEASRFGTIDLDDLEAKRRYFSFRQYSNTKLMNAAFALELAERLKGAGVTSNAVHPGMIGSNFGHVRGWFGVGFSLIKPLMLTPEEGAQTQIWLATSREVEGVTGGYFIRKKQVRPPKLARHPDVRRRLWEASEKLTGLYEALATATG
jgi:NAD(P)-dependent dehydrogenase (short-subunit alcohol dehydrogenase family)